MEHQVESPTTEKGEWRRGSGVPSEAALQRNVRGTHEQVRGLAGRKTGVNVLLAGDWDNYSLNIEKIFHDLYPL